MDERRKNQRFQLQNTCVLNHSKTVGTIIDISMGGLSCSCLDQGECSKGLSTKVNIYCRKKDIRAENITMKVLSTETVKGEFLEDLGLRRCRARFQQLDEEQARQLTEIIVYSGQS